MNRPNSAYTVKETIHELATAYGQEVLDELQRLGADRNQAETVYYRTFLSVLNASQKRSGRKRLQRDPKLLLFTTVRILFEKLQSENVAVDDNVADGEVEQGSEEDYKETLSSEQEIRRSAKTRTADTPEPTTRVHRDAGSTGELHAEILQARLDKLLKAALVESEAARRHRGPTWTVYALTATLAFGLAAIAFGMYHGSSVKASAAADNEVSKVAASFPPPLTNLPVTVKGQLLTEEQPSIQHLAVTSKAAYLPKVISKGPGTASVNLYQSSFSNGKLEAAGVPYIAFQLEAPRTNSGTTAKKVQRWNFQIMNSWGVLVVQWQGSKRGDLLTQIYLMNLSSREHALAATFKPEAGGASSYTVTAGLGKVAVQGILPNNGGAASTGLPLTLYQLKGSDPHHALQKWKVLSSVPGQLVKPTVTRTGILSQGYAGQTPPPDTLNSTWYLVNWQGGVTEEIGPPLDGQQHWAVEGDSGRVWWVETTPGGQKSKSKQLQVLMGSLSDTSASNQPSALSLNGSVTGFHVGDGYLEWIQTTQKVPQLVVAKVE